MYKEILDKAIELRHEIHRYPELSCREKETRKRLMRFLKENSTLEVIDRGEWFYARYKAADAKGKIALRAEMDAVCVEEKNDFEYRSADPGAAHKCGHDGHSAALAAFALQVDRDGADKDIYFIFQHGEEIGAGKPESAIIKEEGIDEIYAIHNLPGMPLGSVNTREGTLCCASLGMILDFHGKQTHASTPELGINPAGAVSEIVQSLNAMIASVEARGLLLATVIGIEVGSDNFGVSAGSGRLLLTVRGQYEDEMNRLYKMIDDRAVELADKEGLIYRLEVSDVFPETANHRAAVEKIRRVCKERGFEYIEMPEPIRTSEDFGYYLKETTGAQIWMGSGEDCPPLHTELFDYRDELIPISCDLFRAIIDDNMI